MDQNISGSSNPNQSGGDDHTLRNVVVAVAVVVVIALIVLAIIGSNSVPQEVTDSNVAGESQELSDEEKAAILEQLATSESEVEPLSDEERAAILEQLGDGSGEGDTQELSDEEKAQILEQLAQ